MLKANEDTPRLPSQSVWKNVSCWLASLALLSIGVLLVYFGLPRNRIVTTDGECYEQAEYALPAGWPIDLEIPSGTYFSTTPFLTSESSLDKEGHYCVGVQGIAPMELAKLKKYWKKLALENGFLPTRIRNLGYGQELEHEKYGLDWECEHTDFENREVLFITSIPVHVPSLYGLYAKYRYTQYQIIYYKGAIDKPAINPYPGILDEFRRSLLLKLQKEQSGQ
jgi:hypothetical protein